MSPQTVLIGGLFVILTLWDGTPLSAAPRVDFDGDGFADLAVGVPDQDVGLTPDAGAVNILYGSADGLAADEDRNQFFTAADIWGGATAGDQFGKALATGDFNGDGFTDLAVGAPGIDFLFVPDGGTVVIFYGGEGGLSLSRTRFLEWISWWDRYSLFGSALAAGDFDNDGFDDLAVGAPDAYREPDNTPGSGSGAVLVWYGSERRMTRRQYWEQGRNGLRDSREYRDQFGAELATGDFNCDGASDLAVGAPGEELLNGPPVGAVNVLYGSDQGLRGRNSQIWTHRTDGGNDEAPAGGRYGEVLAGGDLDGDGCDELVVGAPGAQTVHVIYGTPDRLHSDRTEEIPSFVPGVAIADFGGHGYNSLVLRGDGGVRFLVWIDGLGLGEYTHVMQFQMPGLNEDDCEFPQSCQRGIAQQGYALAADDFYGQGVVDLAVGIPNYNVVYKHNTLQIPEAGAIAVFTNRTIRASDDVWDSPTRAWSETPIIQRSPQRDIFEGYPMPIEVEGWAEPDDHFGAVFPQ